MSRPARATAVPAAVPVTCATPPLGNALLAGASGLVGQALARQWTGPGTLHLLVRRPLPAGRLQRVHVCLLYTSRCV